MAAKRYRYTGKERDEETGLYYHGARYYAAWLGRWTSADPAGMVDEPGLYTYVRNNPVRLEDPTGHLGTVLEFLDDLVNHPSSAIAKGVLDNLDKRGETAVKASAAVAETLRKYGPSGFKAIGGGAHHFIRDTGEALGEITWEVKHNEGDSSKVHYPDGRVPSPLGPARPSLRRFK